MPEKPNRRVKQLRDMRQEEPATIPGFGRAQEEVACQECRLSDLPAGARSTTGLQARAGTRAEWDV